MTKRTSPSNSDALGEISGVRSREKSGSRFTSLNSYEARPFGGGWNKNDAIGRESQEVAMQPVISHGGEV
jgi:hypothetical protein